MAKKLSPLFRPGAKLNPSQVEDLRLLPMRRTEFWEDGSVDNFAPDLFPGGLHPNQITKPRWGAHA